MYELERIARPAGAACPLGERWPAWHWERRLVRTADIELATKGAAAGAVRGTMTGLWDRRWNALPVPMCATDVMGHIVGFNRRAAELWGREPALGESAEPFLGRKLFGARSGGRDEAPVDYVLRTGISLHGKESVILRGDGSRAVCILHIDAVESDDGVRIGAIACFVDVTERKRAQDKLAERELWFRELLEALPTAIYTTDADGRVTFYNQAAVDFAGRRPELGKDEWCVTAKLFHPDGRPMPHDECPMAVALRTGKAVRGTQAIAERPDGSRVPFQPYPTPLHDDEGNLLGAVNMLVDLSERKASEARLELMASEVDHRAKNILAVVQAVMRLTRGNDVGEFRSAVSGRIDALARAHGSLANNRWSGADLQQLINEELAAFAAASAGRIVARGPQLMLLPAAAQSVGMALHELGTNATKYGALSSAQGRLRVVWSFDAGDGLSLRWTESGGPAVRAPERRGIGSNLIERMIRQHGGTTHFDWQPDGLVFAMTLAADQVRAGGAEPIPAALA